MTSRSTSATPSRSRSACSAVSTLPSSPRSPTLAESAIVDLLVDGFLAQIDGEPRWPALSSSRRPNLHQLSGPHRIGIDGLAPERIGPSLPMGGLPNLKAPPLKSERP